MPTRQITVQMPAMIRGKARRQRKVKTFWCTISTAVEVAAVDKLDEPEALILSYQRWAKSGPRRKEEVRVVSAGHRGRLYRPVPGPDYRPRSTFADLAAQAEGWRQNPFFSRFAAQANNLPYAAVVVGMREIHEDRTAWPAERARRVAADLLLVGEELWRCDLEPMWTVTVHGKKVETDFTRPFPNSLTPAIPFPICEREAAERAAESIAGKIGGKRKSSGMKLIAVDARFTSRKRDGLLRETMTTAFHAVRRTLSRQYRGAIPEDVLIGIAGCESMLMPGGSLAGAAEKLDSLSRSIDYELLGLDYPNGCWLKVVNAAIDLGIDTDLIAGGAVMEFDPLDDMLLETLST